MGALVIRAHDHSLLPHTQNTLMEVFARLCKYNTHTYCTWLVVTVQSQSLMRKMGFDIVKIFNAVIFGIIVVFITTFLHCNFHWLKLVGHSISAGTFGIVYGHTIASTPALI